MAELRESVRQWMLVIAQMVGIAGVVYETVVDHVERPHLLTLYALMIGVAQAEQGLGFLRRLVIETRGTRISVGDDPPTLRIPSPARPTPDQTTLPSPVTYPSQPTSASEATESKNRTSFSD